MISILLPAYKSEKLLKNVFFESLHNSARRTAIEIVVYDNGGNGDLNPERTVCRCHAGMTKIIGNGQNIGLNAALNECAKVATGDYFFLPHTDMFLLPGWDIALLNACKNLPPTSFLLCSRSIEPGFSHIPSQIKADYGNEWDNFDSKKLMKEFEKFKQSGIVVNARMPFFMHRKLWEKLGGVDENYFSYCTDDDLIQDCYDKGVRRFWMVYDSLVYHLQGKSNSQQTVDKDSDKPYKYFVNKWKGKYPNIHHPGQYHPTIIPFETKVQ